MYNTCTNHIQTYTGPTLGIKSRDQVFGINVPAPRKKASADDEAANPLAHAAVSKSAKMCWAGALPDRPAEPRPFGRSSLRRCRNWSISILCGFPKLQLSGIAATTATSTAQLSLRRSGPE